MRIQNHKCRLAEFHKKRNSPINETLMIYLNKKVPQKEVYQPVLSTGIQINCSGRFWRISLDTRRELMENSVASGY
jgi:hypothetical protein